MNSKSVKKKKFYSGLVSLDKVFIELKDIHMSDEEKTHLVDIAYSHLHITILDVVLSHLSTGDKEKFLQRVEENDHRKTWEFLKNKIEGIEEKIQSSAENLKKELLEDVKKSKRKAL